MAIILQVYYLSNCHLNQGNISNQYLLINKKGKQLTTNKIELSNTPITIIIRNDKVVNSIQGVISKSALEAAIKAAGITTKNSVVTA